MPYYVALELYTQKRHIKLTCTVWYLTINNENIIKLISDQHRANKLLVELLIILDLEVGMASRVQKDSQEQVFISSSSPNYEAITDRLTIEQTLLLTHPP